MGRLEVSEVVQVSLKPVQPHRSTAIVNSRCRQIWIPAVDFDVVNDVFSVRKPHGKFPGPPYRCLKNRWFVLRIRWGHVFVRLMRQNQPQCQRFWNQLV